MPDIPTLISEQRFHPTPGKFVARIDKVQSYGHLVLPTQAQYETNTSTVVCLGPDLPEYLAVGVRVLPHQHSGLCVHEDDTTRLVVYELKDIQAVFVNPSSEELETFFSQNS